MFEDAPYHFGKSFAGQTLDWMPTDTPERFAELMQDPEHRRYFEELGWHEPGAITYEFNSHGFRCDEFTDEPCLIALGCSYTMGIGLPRQVLWPELVAQDLGLRVANLAWGGYSADSCFRLAEYWVPRLKPELVVLMAPNMARFELLLDHEQLLPHQHRNQLFEVIMPASESNLFADHSFLRHWWGNPENHRLNNLRNCMALQRLCDELDVPCVIDNADHHMWWSREELGYARDFLHGGPPAHRRIADHILNEYQSKKPS